MKYRRMSTCLSRNAAIMQLLDAAQKAPVPWCSAYQQYCSPLGPGCAVWMVGRCVEAGSVTYTLLGSIDTTTA